MSDAVSALHGAVFDGRVTVRDRGLCGMISLRGDLASPALQKAVTGLAGVPFPAPGEMHTKGARGLGWMSPDELLVMGPHDKAPGDVARLDKALKRQHHLVQNVSDARAVFRLEGEAPLEIISKLSPANVAPENFGPGQMRRSRLAQVAAAFWMPENDVIDVVCFRSVAGYVFELLKNAAHPGAPVGFR